LVKAPSLRVKKKGIDYARSVEIIAENQPILELTMMKFLFTLFIAVAAGLLVL
jgi:hypothetical protein